MSSTNMGIYAITNTANGKVYIGCSVELSKRLYMHKFALRRGAHENKLLQRAWNLYGEENFTFEVLERTTDREGLLRLEHAYMAQYHSYDRKYGYNLVFSSDNPDNVKRVLTYEHRRKIAQSHIGIRPTPETLEKMRQAKAENPTRYWLGKKGAPAWNKGLTKDTNEVVSRIAQTKVGKPRSTETRKKLQQAALAYYEGKRSAQEETQV